jgi:hypothetical protein
MYARDKIINMDIANKSKPRMSVVPISYSIRFLRVKTNILKPTLPVGKKSICRIHSAGPSLRDPIRVPPGEEKNEGFERCALSWNRDRSLVLLAVGLKKGWEGFLIL